MEDAGGELGGKGEPEGDVRVTADVREGVDGGRLLGELDVDESEIRWRKEFVGFTDDDRRRLAELDDVFEGVADDLVEEFYENVASHEETVDILGRSTKSISALKRSQVEYLDDLTDGTYDASYFERRARIGKIHDLLDLGPKVYLGAYSVYYEGLLSALAEDAKDRLASEPSRTASRSKSFTERVMGAGDDGETTDAEATDGEADRPGLTPEEAIDEFLERAMSVLRLVNLDQQVAMDTYVHSYSQQMENELDRRRHVCDEVDRTVTELQQMSADVAESSSEILSLVEAQSESTESVASETSQMSATVEEVAATATQVETTSERADSLAADGREAAHEAIDVMETVADAADDAATDVERLQSRVDAIDEVVEVINDIAEQTNLLALNANIEAARAGEEGEGFAVVADEVKSLAEESKRRVGEIETLIEDIQSETDETVRSLEATNERVDEGLSEVESTRESLAAIADAVAETATGIREVSDAMDDQAASMTEITGMMDEVSARADDVREEVERVVAANDRQVEKVDEIEETVQLLVGDQAGPPSSTNRVE
jgi:heme-based aerotactic transducer